MKIISLVAENFKRLQAVEIRPDGNLVQITGKNGNGKTSVLDSIWAVLGGKDACPPVPIRRGQERARIRLETGELILTRVFKRTNGDEYSTALTVESPDGGKFKSPQAMLDELLGTLTFDPLAFARMKPRDQFDQLRRFVPDVDFDAIERLNRGDFDRRADVNRLLDQETAAALAIVVPEGTPAELADEDALVAELAAAGEHNADVERRRANRETARQTIAQSQAIAAETPERIRAATTEILADCDREVALLNEQIQALQARVTATVQSYGEKITAETARITAEGDEARAQAEGLEQRLAEAGELPEPKDIPAMRLKIEETRASNANVRKLLDRAAHERKAAELREKADGFTTAIKQRNSDKEAKIAAAQMPVAGISFGDGIVLLNGVPFQQGSDAEQLRASVAIAMALNPKLRVLRIRDGSLLDEDSLKLVAQMAEERDFQVWIERVDSSGKIGFVLEDGHLAGGEHSTPERAEEAVA